MKISPDELEKLKDLYKKHFGKELTNDQVLEVGQRLLTIFDIILKNQ